MRRLNPLVQQWTKEEQKKSYWTDLKFLSVSLKKNPFYVCVEGLSRISDFVCLHCLDLSIIHKKGYYFSRLPCFTYCFVPISIRFVINWSIKRERIGIWYQIRGELWFGKQGIYSLEIYLFIILFSLFCIIIIIAITTLIITS